MTPTELAYLRGALAARQAEVEDLLRNCEGIAVDPSADLPYPIQHASECDMAIGNLGRESARLREVRAALRRIHAGPFRICLDCEEEISLKRLAAV
jgi:DnaK suppressor protein